MVENNLVNLSKFPQQETTRKFFEAATRGSGLGDGTFQELSLNEAKAFDPTNGEEFYKIAKYFQNPLDSFDLKGPAVKCMTPEVAVHSYAKNTSVSLDTLLETTRVDISDCVNLAKAAEEKAKADRVLEQENIMFYGTGLSLVALALGGFIVSKGVGMGVFSAKVGLGLPVLCFSAWEGLFAFIVYAPQDIKVDFDPPISVTQPNSISILR